MAGFVMTLFTVTVQGCSFKCSTIEEYLISADSYSSSSSSSNVNT